MNRRKPFESWLITRSGLLWHSSIILIAVGLDEFVHFLRWQGLVTTDSPLEWAILTAKYGLLAIDVILLVGAVAKLAWHAWRSL
jgi:hypothetical protein